MRAKIPWILLLTAVCIWIIASHARFPALLQDTDTVAILRAIRERNNPWSWFAGDWPLFNHFYRPVSTLTFELDLALNGEKAAAYGLTNAILAAISTAGLAWLATEVFRDFKWGVLTAVLFAWWTLGPRLDQLSLLLIFMTCLAVIVKAIGFKSAAKPRWELLVTAIAGLLLLMPVEPLRERMIEWIPGRTASTMTVFLFPALASYVRAFSIDSKKLQVQWIVAGTLLTLLALGSYEQAVMIPFILVPLLWFRWQDGNQEMPHAQGYEPKRVGLALCAAALIAVISYALLRLAVIPSGSSAYQAQQFRQGMGVFLGMGDYTLLPIRDLIGISTYLDTGIEVLLSKEIWTVLGWLSFPFLFAAALIRIRSWQAPLALVLASFLAYLPMAFLHPFGHYHFAPMGLRAMLSIWLLVTSYRSLFMPPEFPLSEGSPEARLADPRPSSS